MGENISDLIAFWKILFMKIFILNKYTFQLNKSCLFFILALKI